MGLILISYAVIGRKRLGSEGRLTQYPIRAGNRLDINAHRVHVDRTENRGEGGIRSVPTRRQANKSHGKGRTRGVKDKPATA